MSKRYDPKDPFYRKAKQAGLRARSAFKLEEIAQRFRLFRQGMSVLDLGAAPGGWLQIIAKRVGPKGLVVGLDLQPIEPVGPNVVTIEGDIYSDEVLERVLSLRGERFDVVTSDMAPKTTGIKNVDEARSVELVRHAHALCHRLLRKDGSFVAKVFEGSDFHDLLRDIRKDFGSVKLIRPEATRGRSFEIYVVAMGFSGGEEADARTGD